MHCFHHSKCLVCFAFLQMHSCLMLLRNDSSRCCEIIQHNDVRLAHSSCLCRSFLFSQTNCCLLFEWNSQSFIMRVMCALTAPFMCASAKLLLFPKCLPRTPCAEDTVPRVCYTVPRACYTVVPREGLLSSVPNDMRNVRHDAVQTMTVAV